MPKVALFVRLVPEEGQFDQVLANLKAHAKRSLTLEDGCERFDVTLPKDEPGVIRLFELYQDWSAVEVHRTSAHMQRQRDENDGLINQAEIIEAELQED